MSFWGSLTGSTQKKQINNAYAKANDAYGTANENARGEIDKGYSTATGYINPIIESGRAGGKLYQDTLGVNGADARSAAQDTYLSDDLLQRTRALDLKRSGQVSNAGGGYNSGAGALADSRVNLQNYGNWQNRLQGEQARGDAASMTGAQLAFNTGQAQANREMSYGSAMGGSAIGQGQALAANANTGINNLLKLGGLAVSAFTGTPNGLGGSSSTTPGTQANGGWSTTTNKLSGWNPLNWWS